MEPKLNRFSSTHLLQLVLHSDCNCYSNVEKHSLFIISPARHESCHYSITWHSHPWQTTGSNYQRQQIVVYVARLFGNPFYHFIFLAYFFFFIHPREQCHLRLIKRWAVSPHFTLLVCWQPHMLCSRNRERDILWYLLRFNEGLLMPLFC